MVESIESPLRRAQAARRQREAAEAAELERQRHRMEEIRHRVDAALRGDFDASPAAAHAEAPPSLRDDWALQRRQLARAASASLPTPASKPTSASLRIDFEATAEAAHSVAAFADVPAPAPPSDEGALQHRQLTRARPARAQRRPTHHGRSAAAASSDSASARLGQPIPPPTRAWDAAPLESIPEDAGRVPWDLPRKSGAALRVDLPSPDLPSPAQPTGTMAPVFRRGIGVLVLAFLLPLCWPYSEDHAIEAVARVPRHPHDVWKTVLDVNRWPEWHSVLEVSLQGRVAEGKLLTMARRMTNGSVGFAYHRVTRVSPPVGGGDGCLCLSPEQQPGWSWSLATPSWMLKTSWCIALERTSQPARRFIPGRRQTTLVHSYQRFSGPLSPLVLLFRGAASRRAMEAFAADLSCRLAPKECTQPRG
jgi:hypothetical protein